MVFLMQTHDALQQYGDFLPHDLSALAEAFHYDIDLNEVMVSWCSLLTSLQTYADPALSHTLSIQHCAGLKAAAYQVHLSCACTAFVTLSVNFV